MDNFWRLYGSIFIGGQALAVRPAARQSFFLAIEKKEKKEKNYRKEIWGGI